MVKPVLLPLHHSSVHSQILCSLHSITGAYSLHDGLPPCPIDPQGTLIGLNRNSANACPPNISDIGLARRNALRRLKRSLCRSGRPRDARRGSGRPRDARREQRFNKRISDKHNKHTYFRYCSGRPRPPPRRAPRPRAPPRQALPRQPLPQQAQTPRQRALRQRLFDNKLFHGDLFHDRRFGDQVLHHVGSGSRRRSWRRSRRWPRTTTGSSTASSRRPTP